MLKKSLILLVACTVFHSNSFAAASPQDTNKEISTRYKEVSQQYAELHEQVDVLKHRIEALAIPERLENQSYAAYKQGLGPWIDAYIAIELAIKRLQQAHADLLEIITLQFSLLDSAGDSQSQTMKPYLLKLCDEKNATFSEGIDSLKALLADVQTRFFETVAEVQLAEFGLLGMQVRLAMQLPL